MYCAPVENRTEGSAMLLNFVFKNLNCTTSIHTHLLLGNSGWGHEILWSMGVIMRYNRPILFRGVCGSPWRKKKKKHVISRYRTCDLLTWSQQLFCHGHANILTCNSRAKSDGYKQASKHTYEQKFLHPTP